nr:hypothetical protein [Tanacetum cinerariifolium]
MTRNCPKCGHPVDGHYCQGCALLRKKFKEDLFTYCIENEILQDFSEPSNDNPNVVNAPREPFVVNQDPGIFCHQCTCKLCGNGAHYGYNYLLKVSIIPDPEPFNNQTIKELPPTVQSFDPKPDVVHDSPNIFDPPLQLPFIPCELYGNDAHYGHYCTPQVPFVYPEPCYNQDFNFPQGFHDFQQQDLCSEYCGVTHKAYQFKPKNPDYYHEQISCYDHNSFGFDKFQPHQHTEEEKQIKEEQTANVWYWKIPACYDDNDDNYTFSITPNEPDNSLSMGMSILTLFRDDQSFFDEDLLKEIYSNPLFDEEIISIKIDPHPFNAKSDLIEAMLNHDSSIIFSSKIDSFFDEFAGELTLLKLIPPGIDETYCYPEEETHFIKRLLYDNSSPRPPKEFVFENFDADIKYFSPSPIPVEDNDSLMEEIDLSFTLDYPMPPGIEEDDYDSERDILILKELLSNNSFSLPKNKSFHFDIPSFSHPPAKPPDGDTGILNVKVMGDISKQKVPVPRLMITLVLNQEKSPNLLSHQGLEAFQPSTECPMMIHGKNTFILDVPLFHFYPLDQFNILRNLKTLAKGFYTQVFISSASLGNHVSKSNRTNVYLMAYLINGLRFT